MRPKTASIGQRPRTNQTAPRSGRPGLRRTFVRREDARSTAAVRDYNLAPMASLWQPVHWSASWEQ